MSVAHLLVLDPAFRNRVSFIKCDDGAEACGAGAYSRGIQRGSGGRLIGARVGDDRGLRAAP